MKTPRFLVFEKLENGYCFTQKTKPKDFANRFKKRSEFSLFHQQDLSSIVT